MKPVDLFEETFIALSANKARSFLTILGIVIGISSVIAMIAIGQGAQTTIQKNIQSIGSNLIVVSPGAQRGTGFTVSAGRGSARTLTLEDANAIQSGISQIKAIAPEISSRYQITSPGQNTNTQVIGTTPMYPDVRNLAVAEGSFITDQALRSGSKVAVIGPTVRDDLFGAGASALGQTIRINRIDFQVIGVTATKGGSGFNNPDDIIYIPLSTAQRYLSGGDYVTSISVTAQDAQSTTAVQDQITTLLLDRHHISDPAQADFSTLNQADIIATASSITQIFTILLASVAGISLLVGGIGIMNMMLTTVTERTKEIGLRKSIGAKQAEIRAQFLTEAVALTFLGGLIGIILGWGVATGLTYFGILETTVSLFSILLAFGVSAGIGIIFGYYPARRAAALNPIDALRYE